MTFLLHCHPAMSMPCLLTTEWDSVYSSLLLVPTVPCFLLCLSTHNSYFPMTWLSVYVSRRSCIKQLIWELFVHCYVGTFNELYLQHMLKASPYPDLHPWSQVFVMHVFCHVWMCSHVMECTLLVAEHMQSRHREGLGMLLCWRQDTCDRVCSYVILFHSHLCQKMDVCVS